MKKQSTELNGLRVLFLACSLSLLTACLHDSDPSSSEDTSATSRALASGVRSEGGIENAAPKISGTPAYKALVGSEYIFSPTASDPEGDPLTFSVRTLPRWVTFNPNNGSLIGTPTRADAGTSGKIVIAVSDGKSGSVLSAFSILVTENPSGFFDDPQPILDGTPPSNSEVNEPYSFRPVARSPNGPLLQFGIVNLPSWLHFDFSDGTLSGTPGISDIGMHTGILISVSDGILTDTLGPFEITVGESTDNLVTLSWPIPVENEDGTPLTDLVGYRIRYGSKPGNYTNSIDLDDPWMTSYTIAGLASGSYYFVSTAYNQMGIMSNLSNEVSVIVN